MDLHTISNKLQNDKYDNDATFWNDVNVVFSNTIKYHRDQINTKWIAKFTKDMMKAVTQECILMLISFMFMASTL